MDEAEVIILLAITIIIFFLSIGLSECQQILERIIMELQEIKEILERME